MAVINLKDVAAVETLVTEIKTKKTSKVKCGIREIDEKGGLARGEVYILAGEPLSGRSPYLLNMALSIAFHGGAVYWLSNRFLPEEFLKKIIFLECGVEYKNQPDFWELREVRTVIESFENLDITFCDTSGLTLAEISNQMEEETKKYDLIVLESDLGFLPGSSKCAMLVEKIAKVLSAPVFVIASVHGRYDESGKPVSYFPTEADLLNLNWNNALFHRWFLYNPLLHSNETGRSADKVQIKRIPSVLHTSTNPNL